MRKLGRALRTCSFGLLLITSVAAFSAQVNVTCTNTTADAVKLNTAIDNSHSGDRIQIHGTCLLNATIILLSDRTYEGDSRTGTILRQASGSNLPALVASDSWNDDWTYTGDPIRIAHLTLDGNGSANSSTNALVIRSWLTVIEVGLEVLSSSNNVRDVHTARSIGAGVKLVDGY